MTDLTDRATEAGWTLPEGWTVQAEAMPDEHLGHPRDEYGTDAYDEEACAAFDRGDWGWCYVRVVVRDAQGRDWGSDGIGGVEWGQLPGAGWLDPLDETPGSYSVVREHDMIVNALRDALKSLETFDTLFVQHLDEMYGCDHSEPARREVTVQHCECGALGLYDTHEDAR